jgi:predicted Zn-dependent protease
MLEEIKNLLNNEVIEVTPQNFHVALNTNDQFAMNLEIPPLEELERIRKLSFNKISLDDTLAANQDLWAEASISERDRMYNKWDEYKTSKTYLNRLAILNKLAGNESEAKKLLIEAHSYGDFPLGAHLSQNFISIDEYKEIENPSDNFYYSLFLAYAMLKKKKFKEAETCLQKALKLEPLNIEAMTLAGIFALTQGTYVKAVRYFKEAINEKPNSPVLCVNLAVSYLYLGENTKALSSLRKAVALNPIDKNAVFLYADLLAKEEKQHCIIRILKTYLKYDEKDLGALDRLARAYFLAGDFKDALNILENTLSIEPTINVFNNIGIVYIKMEQFRNAYRYFSLGLKKWVQTKSLDYILISNFLRLLVYFGEFRKIVLISEKILFAETTIESFASQKIISNICINYLYSLYQLDKKEYSIQEAERLVELEIDSQLKFELLLFITYYYTLNDGKLKKEYFCKLALEAVDKNDWDKLTRQRLINNVCVSYIECGEIGKAEELISQLSPLVHKNPIITATLGLYNIRKGNQEKGEAFYREALHLTKDQILVSKLKQKLNLELGRFYIKDDKKTRASACLKKVLKEKKGIEEFRFQARALLSAPKR